MCRYDPKHIYCIYSKEHESKENRMQRGPCDPLALNFIRFGIVAQYVKILKHKLNSSLVLFWKASDFPNMAEKINVIQLNHHLLPFPLLLKHVQCI